MKKLVIKTATVNDASLKAPPPPKRSRKSLIALLVIAIAIVATVVGAYLIVRGSSPSSNNNNNLNNNNSNNNNSISVENASSLKFSYTVTSEGYSAGTFTYITKNIGASNLMIRSEYTTPSGTTIYIVNGVQQKYWFDSNGDWTDLSSLYSGQVQVYNAQLVPFINDLKSWSGVGDYTYTAPNGDSIRYFNIAVNPTLADSLFQP